MTKYICIHGHFYQPPRENPWTDTIDAQPSAHPFHDWNQRIASECYAPNTECHVIGDHNEVLEKINNYVYISFNFGPTLLSWLEENDEATYEKILAADRISRDYYDGHGSAIAQCYNHMIMPLANDEDRKTQVYWGVEDFKHRFGRPPEGMWLPETGVDLKTLEALVDEGIQFTILAPKQAKQIRKMGDANWENVTEHDLHTQRSYRCVLPSGRTIDIFFYDGVVSGHIAFGKIIRSAHEILHEINRTWKDDEQNPLFSAAVDGETFGHHRRFGDMALARVIYETKKNKNTHIINYAAYLAKFPSEYEVQIHENTAWSSSEGLERWKSAGGGCIHHRKNWTQAWRAPLREAMDFLRDAIKPHYEDKIKSMGHDPWEVRNQYIQALLTKSAKDPLLEMQKNLMYMYTSCGWFFDDISGIEARQILLYAARVLDIAKKHLDLDVEEDFLQILKKAKSNTIKWKDGRYIFEHYVKPLKP